MSKDNAYLADIVRAANAIRRFVEGVNKEQFVANEEKYEAARHLSPEMRASFPDIPWALVTAMRNILIHDYDDVNLDVVWNTTQDDLPPLIAKIDAYLTSHPPEPGPQK